jgi:2-polyprenyl-3-methyl-5-hydroxy-6-metoxy-1,4-benzoquinol methylase
MSKSFEYREIDIEGMETLTAIEEADLFNEWMYQTIKPYCKGKVLEIGSGIGNISGFFIRDGYKITLSDLRENYVERLSNKFASEENQNLDVIKLDLVHPDFEKQYAHLLGTFDTLFALNVVEHIEDDRLSLANSKKLLKKGGHLIILVPAYQWLYNRFDTELEHYRRYDKKSLREIFLSNEFEVLKSKHFNFTGIFGWFISGKLQNNRTIPKGQMALYNKLVPIFKCIDAILFNSAGLSVVLVGKKNN